MGSLVRWSVIKKLGLHSRRPRSFDPWVGEIPEKEMATHSSVTSAGSPAWTEEPAGCSPWGDRESRRGWRTKQGVDLG